MLAQTDVMTSFLLESWRPEELMTVYISLLLTTSSSLQEDAEGRGQQGSRLCMGRCPSSHSVVFQGWCGGVQLPGDL